MVSYQKPYQKIDMDDTITQRLSSIQASFPEKWNGISSNELWVKLNRSVKGKKYICSKPTYLKAVNRLIESGLLKINKSKKWKRKRLLKLDSTFIKFYRETKDFESYLDWMLDRLEDTCKKENKAKSLVTASATYSAAIHNFGVRLYLSLTNIDTDFRKLAYYENFIEYSNILLSFTKRFAKINKKYGLDKKLKFYQKSKKNLLTIEDEIDSIP